jgi:hypothetical protein
MENHDTVYHQLDFFHLLPGSAGGRALRALKGNGYFAELARNAAARRTKEERQAIHTKGVQERLRRLYTIPRTEVSMWQGCSVTYELTERVIPWWPHQKNRHRRKRPVFVRIELRCLPVTENSELGKGESALA